MKKRKHLLKVSPPKELFTDYYHKLQGNPLIYMCFLRTGKDKKVIYLEKSHKKNSAGVCRVFVEEHDAASYAALLANIEGREMEDFYIVPFSLDNAYKYLRDLSDKHVYSIGKEVESVGSVIHKNVIYSLEDFISNDDRDMV